LIARLIASGHVCAFTKCTLKLNSLLLKRQMKNSLRNDASAKLSIKQQTFTNAYLLIYGCKKRRNSRTYLTNINSFSKAPSNSYPPNVCTSNSNPMPSLSMDTFATSMSFASATKANGLHLLLELPRKMVRFDLSQTSAN
jgi:hypothetical protein